MILSIFTLTILRRAGQVIDGLMMDRLTFPDAAATVIRDQTLADHRRENFGSASAAKTRIEHIVFVGRRATQLCLTYAARGGTPFQFVGGTLSAVRST